MCRARWTFASRSSTRRVAVSIVSFLKICNLHMPPIKNKKEKANWKQKRLLRWRSRCQTSSRRIEEAWAVAARHRTAVLTKIWITGERCGWTACFTTRSSRAIISWASISRWNSGQISKFFGMRKKSRSRNRCPPAVDKYQLRILILSFWSRIWTQPAHKCSTRSTQ